MPVYTYNNLNVYIDMCVRWLKYLSRTIYFVVFRLFHRQIIVRGMETMIIQNEFILDEP